jgi:hypothetical protein
MLESNWDKQKHNTNYSLMFCSIPYMHLRLKQNDVVTNNYLSSLN